MSKRNSLPNWRIAVIRGKRAQEIGTVTATDEKSAIKVAIKDFEITDPDRQKRLAARPDAYAV